MPASRRGARGARPRRPASTFRSPCGPTSHSPRAARLPAEPRIFVGVAMKLRRNMPAATSTVTASATSTAISVLRTRLRGGVFPPEAGPAGRPGARAAAPARVRTRGRSRRRALAKRDVRGSTDVANEIGSADAERRMAVQMPVPHTAIAAPQAAPARASNASPPAEAATRHRLAPTRGASPFAVARARTRQHQVRRVAAPGQQQQHMMTCRIASEVPIIRAVRAGFPYGSTSPCIARSTPGTRVRAAHRLVDVCPAGRWSRADERARNRIAAMPGRRAPATRSAPSARASPAARSRTRAASPCLESFRRDATIVRSTPLTRTAWPSARRPPKASAQESYEMTTTGAVLASRPRRRARSGRARASGRAVK